MSSNSAIDSLRDKRTEQSERERDRGRGRGSYINYYNDLGFSTTDTAHTKWRKEEDLYQKAKAQDYEIINKHKGLIEQAEKDYQGYQFNAPNISSESEKAYWQGAIPNSKKVHIVNFSALPMQHHSDPDKDREWSTPSSNIDDGKYTIEGTYYLPKDSSIDTKGLRTYTKDNDLYISVISKGPNEGIGQKLHDAFRNAQDEYAAKYKNAVSGQMKSALGKQQSAFDANKQQAWDQISSAKAEVQAAEERIRANDQLRADQMNVLRTNYQNRLNTIRSIFSGSNE